MNAQEHMAKIKAAIREMQKETGVVVEYINVEWVQTLCGKSDFLDAKFTVRSDDVDGG